MRDYLIPTMLLIIGSLYCACHSEDDDYTPKPVPMYDVIEVDGENIKDSLVTIYVNDSAATSMTFMFSQITGDPENDKVTCYISGLHSGITASPDSIVSTLPKNLNPMLAVAADTGIYTVNVNVYSTALGLHTYPMKIRVLPTFDCSTDLDGPWSSVYNCSYTDSCTVIVSCIPGMPHWISIKNVACLGDSIFANAFVSCSDGITIPLQTNHGYTMYGRMINDMTGHYQFVSIPDTIVHNGDTEVCILHLSRP